MFRAPFASVRRAVRTRAASFLGAFLFLLPPLPTLLLFPPVAAAQTVPVVSVALGGSGTVEENDLFDLIEFVVTLAPASSQEVTISFTMGGTAVEDVADDSNIEDWGFLDGFGGEEWEADENGIRTLTFAPGDTERTIGGIFVLPDDRDEPDETLVFTLLEPAVGAATLGTATAQVTIQDVDTPLPVLTTSPSVTESGGLEFRLVQSCGGATGSGAPRPCPSYLEQTWHYAVSGTAVEGEDYTDPGGSPVTLAAGDTGATITFETNDDALDEPDETVIVALVTAGGDPIDYPSRSVFGNASPRTGTILDNDDPPAASVAAPASAVTEGGSGDLEFTVTLDAPSGRPVTVPYTLGGTAVVDEDYTDAGGGTLTVPAGDTSATISLETIDDELDELDETVVVTLSAPSDGSATVGGGSGGGGASSSATGTIEDDGDQAPQACFFTPAELASPPAVTYLEMGESATVGLPSFVEVPVSLDRPSGRPVTVRYVLEHPPEAPATENVDYTDGTGGTVTFAPGETSKTVRLDAIDDELDEGAPLIGTREYVEVSEDTRNSEGVRGWCPAAERRRVHIVDDDEPPTVSVAPPSPAVVAEGEDLVFTVTLNAASGRPVTVPYTLGGSARGAGEDYTHRNPDTDTDGNLILTFQPGETSKTIVLATLADTNTREPREDVRVTLLDPAGSNVAHLNPAMTTARGQMDEPLIVELRFGPGLTNIDTSAFLRESEVGIPVNVAIVQRLWNLGGPNPAMTISYSLGGTATEGADYRDVTGGTLTLGVDEIETPITLEPLQDVVNEVLRETIEITLDGYAWADPSVPHIVRFEGSPRTAADIIDDDPKPQVSIAPPTPAEVTEGQGALVFPVTLNRPSGRTVTVPYRLGRTRPGDAEPGVDYTPADPDTRYIETGLTNRISRQGYGVVTFLEGETEKAITLTTVDDDLEEVDETASVQLAFGIPSHLPQLSGADVNSAAHETEGIIVDDEDPLSVSIAVPEEPPTEGEDLLFTVTLSQPNGRHRTIYVPYTLGGTAMAGEDADYTDATSGGFSSPGRLAFEYGVAERTITLNTADDDIYEQGETVVVTLGAAQDLHRNAVADAVASEGVSATGTIADAETPPVVSIDDPAVASVDEGEALVFPVMLSGESSREIVVSYTHPGTGTAVEGEDEDYTDANGGTVTFAPGARDATIRLATRDDTADEPDETVEVTLEAPPEDSATLEEDPTAMGTIIDGDAPPVVSIDAPPAAVAEGGGNLVFTVTLDAASGKTVTVPYRLGRGRRDEAEPGTDYAPTDTGTQYLAVEDSPGNPTFGYATVTFAPGETRQPITLATTEDELDEEDEAVSVLLDWAVNLPGFDRSIHNGRLGSVVAAEGTILDDDDPPSVSIAAPAAPVTEGGDGSEGSGNLVFTVTLDGSSGLHRPIFIPYTLGGTATEDEDYTDGQRGVVSFDTGETSKTITLETVADALHEGSETVVATLLEPVSPSADAATLGTAAATGTIADGDPEPEVSIAGPSAAVAEGDPIELTVSLSVASSREIVVPYTLGGTATEGEDADYTDTGTGTVTFAPGDTERPITLATRRDMVDEPPPLETVVVALQEPSGEGPASLDMDMATITVTIEDGDPEPEVSINPLGAPVFEGDDLVFPVYLTNASAQTVTVPYTLGGTATEGEDADYTDTGTGTLTFAPGDTEQLITLETHDDDVDEPDRETVEVMLRAPSSGTASLATSEDAATDTGTILDNDERPLVTIEATTATATEGGDGSEGSENLVFTVTLSRASWQPITVAYGLGGTASTEAGVDYTDATANPGGGSLTVPAGATEGTIVLATLSDDVDEPAETVVVTLGALTGGPAALGPDATATGTIADGNDEPVVTVVAPGAVDEGDALEFTVRLSVASSREIVVPYTLDGTAEEGEDLDYTHAGTGTVTFAPGDTSAAIAFATRDDDVHEPPPLETVVVELESPEGPARLGTPSTATGTIRDADSEPEVSISPLGAPVVEGGDLVFPVRLTNASAQPVTVPYTLGGTADEGTDYTDVTGDSPADNGTLTFAPGDTVQFVTLQTIDDDVDERDEETVEVTLSDPSSGAAMLDEATNTGTILDNDDPPSVSIAGPDDAAQEGEELEFKVTLSRRSWQAITVAYGLGGTAEAGSDKDYTDATANPGGGSLTVAAGATGGSIVLATRGDMLHEPGGPETAVVTLGALSGGTASLGTPSSATGTIEDGDGEPEVTVAGPNAAVDEGGDIEFTVRLSVASAREIAVPYTLGGTAAEGEDADYTHAGASPLTFAPGDTSATVTLTTLPDSLDEPDETVEMALGTPSGGPASLGTAAAAEATIADGDPEPVVSVSAPPGPVSEGEVLSFPVRLSVASSRTLTVPYTLGGTATAGTDYTDAGGGELTVEPGVTEMAIMLATLDDETSETPETVEVTLGTPAGGPASLNDTARTAQATLTDNDGAPLVSIAGPAEAVAEGGGDLVFTVRLSRASSREVTVDYTLGGTATAGADYTDGGAGTLTFPANSTDPQTITLTTLLDSVAMDELDETVVVTLENPSPSDAAVLSMSSMTAEGTIADVDPTPEVSIEATTASVTEGGDGSPGSENLVFAVSLSVASDRDVEVPYTLGGTATEGAGNDYTHAGGATGALTVGAGTTSATLTIPTLDDGVDEPDETVVVTLERPAVGEQGETLATLEADPMATGTIEDDESTPVVSIAEPAAPVTEGGDGSPGSENLVFTVRLDVPSSRTVRVPYTLGGTATAGGDYTDTGGRMVSIPAGMTSATITLTTLPDSVDEVEETVVVTLGAPLPSGAATLAADPTATGRIADDDSTPEVEQTPPGSVPEGEDMVFPVTLSGVSSRTVTVTYTLGGDAVAGADYTDETRADPADNGTLTFRPGDTSQTIRLATIEDGLDEPPETVEVTLTIPDAGAGEEILATLGATSTAEGTIADGDPTPRVSIEATTASVTEGGDPSSPGSENLVFTVRLGPVPSSRDVEVPYTLGGTATEGTGNDYMHAGGATGMLTIMAGTTSATLTIPTLDDDVDEPDETVAMTLGAPSPPDAATIPPPPGSMATGTIVDDESTPVVSIDESASTLAVAEGGDLVFTVSLDVASSQAVRVRYDLSGVGENRASSDDYTDAGGGMVTVPAGSRSATIALATVDDVVDEPDEMVRVTLVAAEPSDAAALAADPTATGTIEDANPTPEVPIGAPPGSVLEGQPLVFPVTLDGVSSRRVTVTYALGGTATAGEDYDEPAAREVVFQPGDTSQTITLVTRMDEVDEASETVVVTLMDAAGLAMLGASSAATGTIADATPSPRVRIGEPSAMTEGAELAFPVTLDRMSTRAVTVAYTLGGTASTAAGVDYTDATVNPGGGMVTVPANTPADTSAASIALATVDDALHEPDETVVATLTIPSGSADLVRLGTPAAATGTIEDGDDEPVVSVVDPAAAATEGGDLVFTVRLDPVASSRELTVQYTLGGGETNPASSDDYTDAGGGMLTIPANARTAPLTLATVDDVLHELDETVAVTLTALSGDDPPASVGAGAARTAEGTIADGDAAPEVSIAAPDEAAAEGEDLVFPVELSIASSRPVTVEYAVSGGATNPASVLDWTDAGGGALTIPANVRTASIALGTQADGLNELSETVVVELTIPSGSTDLVTLGTPSSATGTIADGDPRPEVSVGAPPGGAVTEGGSLEFPVTLSEVSGRTVTVPYTLGGDAEVGEDKDYTDPGGGTVTIPAGSRSATIALGTRGDSLDEAPEMVRVTLGAPLEGPEGTESPATLGEATATGMIDDGDPPPSASVVAVAAAASVDEGGDLEFTVRLSEASGRVVTVPYGLSGTAEQGADYTNASAGTVTFAVGDTERTLTIRTVDDTLDENDETVVVSLSAPSDGTATVGAPATATGTITDGGNGPGSVDDPPPSVSIVATRASVAEGGTLEFTVTLSEASGRTVTVPYTLGGTAEQGADYANASAGTVTFAAGETGRPLTIETVDDTLDENDETVVVSLAAPADGTATLGTPATAVGTITDGSGPGGSGDDPPPSASIVATRASVAEGGTLEFTVTLSEASGRTATVPYTLGGTAATEAGPTGRADYGDELQGALVFRAGETARRLRIETIADGVDEEDETVVVSLAPAPDGTAALGSPATATGTIEDGDAAPVVSVSVAGAGSAGAEPPPVPEGDDLVFEVSLGHPSSRTLTIHYRLDGTDPNHDPAADAYAAEGEDYTDETTDPSGGAGVLTFAPGETGREIRIATIDDRAPEGVETVVAVLSLPPPPSGPGAVAQAGHGLVTLGKATAVGKIMDRPGGGRSVLIEPRRRAAAMLLRHHVNRFSNVTSAAALGRLEGRPQESLTARASDDTRQLDGTWRLGIGREAWGWSGWSSITYGWLDGNGDGEAWDLYLGADYLSESGDHVAGALLGYEVGRLWVDGVRFRSEYTELGVYGATRLDERLTLDGAMAYGFAEPELEAPPVSARYKARRLTFRADLTGNFDWGFGDAVRIEPRVGVLYARERLGAFTDSDRNLAGAETLSLSRLSAGPRLTRDFAGGRFVGQARMHWDSHTLDGPRMNASSGSLDGRLLYDLGGHSSLEYSGSWDGLGTTGRYRSMSLGITFRAEF